MTFIKYDGGEDILVYSLNDADDSDLNPNEVVERYS